MTIEEKGHYRGKRVTIEEILRSNEVNRVTMGSFSSTIVALYLSSRNVMMSTINFFIFVPFLVKCFCLKYKQKCVKMMQIKCLSLRCSCYYSDFI